MLYYESHIGDDFRIRGAQTMKNRLRLRLGVGVIAAVLVGTLNLAGVGNASGALSLQLPTLSILPTTTTLTATPTTQVNAPNEVFSVTATVGPIDLGITPSGSVTFTVTAPGSAPAESHVITLGPINLSSCVILLSTCTASASDPLPVFSDYEGLVPSGSYTVVAHYSGDALSQASAGSTTFAVTGAPSPPL